MKKNITTLFIFCILISFNFYCAENNREVMVVTGAQQTEVYLPLLLEKRVGILTNHTATIGERHLVDTLVSLGVNIQTIFAPEHGFRGVITAGHAVPSEVDPETGISIVSVFGRSRYIPADSIMQQLDIVVYDIQDVGLRFYTYLSSMYYMMEACARNHVPLILLDRPNPNGHYVDGPILDVEKYRSIVGVLPIPVVHGMTLGELAGMINGKYWLKDSLQCDVTVIKCLNYTHQTFYHLPIPPSPNLPNSRSIYLYPALCPFEGTVVNLGRGTDWPFQVYGHSEMTGYDFSFTPTTFYAEPPFAQQVNMLCYGVDLRTEPSNEEVFKDGFTLKYVIDAYQNLNDNTQIGELFFRSFFERLVGVPYIRTMIMEGKSDSEIKACWKEEVEQFKNDRTPFLLYPL
ncbi:MAG: DUF1343 domain-containing protein [Bacteroidales bacterium]|nr:DUF1343 domain-containing protein [Bacteroidales bacterium]